jgi:hypothetical protein
MQGGLVSTHGLFDVLLRNQGGVESTYTLPFVGVWGDPTDQDTLSWLFSMALINTLTDMRGDGTGITASTGSGSGWLELADVCQGRYTYNGRGTTPPVTVASYWSQAKKACISPSYQ